GPFKLFKQQVCRLSDGPLSPGRDIAERLQTSTLEVGKGPGGGWTEQLERTAPTRRGNPKPVESEMAYGFLATLGLADLLEDLDGVATHRGKLHGHHAE